MRKVFLFLLGAAVLVAGAYAARNFRLQARKEPLACNCEEHRAGALPAKNPVPAPSSAPQTGATFAHVAPILHRHCVSCHQPDSVAPFPLRNYEEAAPYAFAISAAVTARRMPPFNLDNSGACQTFQNARWLSQSEIDTIQAWVRNGLPRGSAPALAAQPPPERLEEPDHRYDIGTDYKPQGPGPDDFHCFEIETRLPSEEYVTAYEVVPGDARIVHHVNLFAWDDPAAPPLAQEASCEQVAPEKMRWLGGWAPGVSMVRWPTGLGVRLSRNQRIIAEIHYFAAGDERTDRTEVLLETTKGPLREALFAPIGNENINLPPGQERVDVSAVIKPAQPLPPTATLLGVVPHMHKFGKSLRLSIDAAGDRCLAHADRWNFYQHGFFFYEKPLRLKVDDNLAFRLTCQYDTRGATAPISFGMQTGNEMCQAMLIYAQDATDAAP